LRHDYLDFVLYCTVRAVCPQAGLRTTGTLLQPCRCQEARRSISRKYPNTITNRAKLHKPRASREDLTAPFFSCPVCPLIGTHRRSDKCICTTYVASREGKAEGTRKECTNGKLRLKASISRPFCLESGYQYRKIQIQLQPCPPLLATSPAGNCLPIPRCAGSSKHFPVSCPVRVFSSPRPFSTNSFVPVRSAVP